MSLSVSGKANLKSFILSVLVGEKFCLHLRAEGKWVFISAFALLLLGVKYSSILFCLSSGFHCCFQRYLEAFGPRCQGKKGQTEIGKNNSDIHI